MKSQTEAFPSLVFVQGPSRLPAPPKGAKTAAVLDVAFASADGFDSVTDPFIGALGPRLRLWCDHHEHPMGWVKYGSDPRFVLVPNRVAHACPELITRELAQKVGIPDVLFIHADLDGVLTAVKLLRGGVEAWSGADEDARAVDSPGRGHCLSQKGDRFAQAIDEALSTFTASERREFFKALVMALTTEEMTLAFSEQVDRAAEASRVAQRQAQDLAVQSGRMELKDVFVIRVAGRRKGRERKALLRYAEERAPVGVVIECDEATHHAWLTAATFQEDLDLSAVRGLNGGRSDFRGAESNEGPKAFTDILRRISWEAAER